METMCRKTIFDYNATEIINEIKNENDLNEMAYQSLLATDGRYMEEQDAYEVFIDELLFLSCKKNIIDESVITGFRQRKDNRNSYTFFKDIEKYFNIENEAAFYYKDILEKKANYKFLIFERENKEDTGKPTFRPNDFKFLDFKIVFKKTETDDPITMYVDFKVYKEGLQFFLKKRDLERTEKHQGFSRIIILSKGEFFIFDISSIKFALNKIKSGYSSRSYKGEKLKEGKNGIWVGSELDSKKNILLFSEFEKNNCKIKRVKG